MTADSKVDLRYRQITYLYPQVKRLFSEQLQAFDPIYKSFDFDRLLGWHTLSVISSYSKTTKIFHPAIENLQLDTIIRLTFRKTRSSLS